MKISKLGEFGLIDVLKKYAPVSKDVILGIGDDTAVLPYTKDKHLLFTTDMFAQDVHFSLKMKAGLIGRKALACNISDIAAMGGLPTFALVSIGLSKNCSVKFVKELYKGMGQLAKAFDVSIVGGDTIKSDKMIINIALLGEVKKKNLVTRSGAKPGDLILVTGGLGGSLTSGRHLSFIPRVKESQFLISRYKPSAMMDISDGLAGDLNHILKASQVGARLFKDRIPLNKGVSLKEAMTDGEDFELLFTLSKPKLKNLLRVSNKYFVIGEITSNQNQRINAKSFTHF